MKVAAKHRYPQYLVLYNIFGTESSESQLDSREDYPLCKCAAYITRENSLHLRRVVYEPVPRLDNTLEHGCVCVGV
jgi:hypothetical protein